VRDGPRLKAGPERDRLPAGRLRGTSMEHIPFTGDAHPIRAAP